jgi:hypothetical protein
MAVIALKKEVSAILRTYVTPSSLQKIYQASSSQACEAFFSVVTGFRPKAIYQPHSEKGQIARATLVWNDGWDAVSIIFEELGIEPTSVLTNGTSLPLLLFNSSSLSLFLSHLSLFLFF